MNAAHQLGQTVGQAAACRALNAPRASLYRHLRPPGEPTAPPAPRPSPPRALTSEERQHVENSLLFGGRQSAGRTPARGRGGGRLVGAEVAIERSPRHVERAAGSRPAHLLAELEGGSHEFSSPLLSSGSEIPSRADTFFCTSMMGSACSRRRLRRAFSFRRCWFSSVCGLTVDLRPRFLGVKASSSPCSFWRRQVVRWDEYNPSRRSSAPMAPSSRQASACATMER